jgi:hypothetical protein
MKSCDTYFSHPHIIDKYLLKLPNEIKTLKLIAYQENLQLH